MCECVFNIMMGIRFTQKVYIVSARLIPFQSAHTHTFAGKETTDGFTTVCTHTLIVSCPLVVDTEHTHTHHTTHGAKNMIDNNISTHHKLRRGSASRETAAGTHTHKEPAEQTHSA